MEHDDLLYMLNDQRRTFRITLRGLTAADAVKRSTVSELTLGGLLKHLTQGERAYTHILTVPLALLRALVRALVGHER